MMNLLVQYRVLILTVHVLFMAIGVGGATVSDILFFRFLKDYRISQKEVEVLHVLKSVIMTVMMIIVFSGIALYLPSAERLAASPMFRVKTIASAILVLNGIGLHMLVAPRLIRFNLRGSNLQRRWRKLAFALGSISITSWYSVFLIAMLKAELPWGFNTMLAGYSAVLLSAVAVSQVMEHFMTKKAQAA
jgi:hypothetical protein